MRLLTAYALGRAGFGAALLAAPRAAGHVLSGAGGATPDAQAFVRGMGGREVGIGAGLLAATRAGASARPWLVAGVLSDAGDLLGIAGAWRDLPPEKRVPGAALAAAAAATGLVLLAR
ncbi:MAG TPA: hypothetical protein VGJ32_13810 [Solirubrobacteraceae bacterium]|jgi:hypothetical protein